MMKFDVNESMHPFAIARFVGTNILNVHLNNKNVEYWMDEAKSWNNFFLKKRKLKFWSYPYFQHMIADYMNLCGLFGESYSIAKTINYFDEDYEIESGYTEALHVISSIARHSVSSFDYERWFINKSEKYFESINPLFKKYYQLQALCIYRCLTKGRKREKAGERIRKLITETGFVYFSKFPE